MTQKEVLDLLASVGAVITGSHIVYTSGRHGTAYVNKDAVYRHTQVISALCREIALQFPDSVDVVVSPAIGGVILSQWVAHHQTRMTGRNVLSLYAERDEESLNRVDQASSIDVVVTIGDDVHVYSRHILAVGEELIRRKSGFVFRRGYEKDVAGKRVLVVEDVLTTGGSVKKVIETTRAAGGEVIGLGVLCNRGGITPENVAMPPKLFALVDVTLDSWTEAECPLCAQQVPVNTGVGKGKDFLARQQKQ